MMENIFFISIKGHTFSEPQAWSNLNDDDDNNDDNNNDDDDDINKDNKEEEENEEEDDENLFLPKVSSVIPFRNHKLS